MMGTSGEEENEEETSASDAKKGFLSHIFFG